MRNQKRAASEQAYEPLVTPENWKDDELRFSVRLTQILDGLFARLRALRAELTGKLGRTEQAADSAMLAGKPPEDFLPAYGTAANAEKLGGVEASGYALKTDAAPDSAKLGGKPPEDFLPADGTAANAEKLGGVGAASYALKTDTAPDSAKLGGKAPEYFLPADGTAANSSKFNGKTWANMLSAVYPVGSIYMSVNSTSPAGLFGGTWELLKGRFLLGAGGSYSAGSTGGASTVSFTPSGTNAGTAITAAQMPQHRHTTQLWNNAGTKANAKKASNYGASVADTTSGLTGTWGSWQSSTFQVAHSGYGDPNGITDVSGGGQTHTHTFSGKSQTIDKMPPYLAVYMWKRVA